MRSLFPAATSAEVSAVAERAVLELGVTLHRDYLQLVKSFNGGGKSVCFYSTHSRQIDMLGRTMTAPGIVEQNVQHRVRGIIGEGEVAYADGDQLLFLPGDESGLWTGREWVSRQVLWQGSFHDLLRYAFEDDARTD